MRSADLYWPVYKNLEKEVLTLANFIHFSDDQSKVYSMHIADLLVRCSIEIEAISKELYSLAGGNMTPTDKEGNLRDLYFDTDCLDYLEHKWKLSKKQITISGTAFYFGNNYKTLTPLFKANKRGTSGSKWKQAYQAVKHDRYKSLNKATIWNLLQALGALYILNLYYGYEKTDIGRVYLCDRSFDNRVGSEIFSSEYYSATVLEMSLSTMNDSNIIGLSDESLDKAVFIVKYDDKSFEKMHRDYCLDQRVTIERFNQSDEIADFLSSHPEYREKSVNEICMAAGGEKLLRAILCLDHALRDKDLRLEAVVNKHGPIYPEVTE